MESLISMKIIWCHCNICSGPTKHDLISEKTQGATEFEEGYHYEWSKTSSLIECRGCEEVTLRVDRWHSEYDASDETVYYPPRISRQPPKWERNLPREWRSMLREIYSALHANSRRLAMMGARTIVDMYMNDAVGDVGNFGQKLEKLVSDGHLGSQDKAVLEAALEAGHAAAHRGHLPTSENINHVMDIVENLVQKNALRKSAALLAKGTPPRQRVNKPTKKA